MNEGKTVGDAFSYSINYLCTHCHGNSKQAGWWTNIITGYNALDSYYKHSVVAEKIALIHSELSEGLEAYRKDKKDDHLPHFDGLTVELADACIRIFDLAGALELNLGAAIVEKIEYNKQRQDHKIENRLKDGGKKI